MANVNSIKGKRIGSSKHLRRLLAEIDPFSLRLSTEKKSSILNIIITADDIHANKTIFLFQRIIIKYQTCHHHQKVQMNYVYIILDLKEYKEFA